MTKSTVIPSPASDVQRLLSATVRDRCVCCGGPTLPVLDRRGTVMLCHRCARFCKTTGDKYAHVIPPRIDWAAADRRWAVDLGFKRLGS